MAAPTTQELVRGRTPRQDSAEADQVEAPRAPVPLPTLVVGAANDAAEVDADRAADAALARLAPAEDVHQHGASCVHRSAAPPASEAVVGARGGELDGDVSAEISDRLGKGRALPSGVRRQMEGAFGGSFSSVRVHDDDRAADLSRLVSARAFTVGSDVFFDRGQFAPETPDGARVLAHELAHTRQQDGGGARRLLHRLAYTDNPGTWGGEIVRRSGEGIKGVFFVGANRDVVVKPLESTGTVEYANEFMGAMNLPAPQSVRYAKGTPQGNAIEGLLRTAQGARSANEVDDQIDAANAYLVMEKMGGKSIQTLDDAEAAEFLGNTAALEDTGRIMVADAFLGNGDRLLGNVNLGNFFYQAATILVPGKVNTIDNDMSIKEGETRTNRAGNKVVTGDLESKLGFLEMLMDPVNRQGPILAFLTKFSTTHRNNATAIGYLTGNRPAIIQSISDGIANALADMATLFTDNMDLVRDVSVGDVESEDSRNASAAKGVAKYVKARQNGTSKADAEKKLVKYVEYRAKRDRTPSGFKWVAKLTSKTGF